MNRSQNQRRGAVIGLSALAGLAAAALGVLGITQHGGVAAQQQDVMLASTDDPLTATLANEVTQANSYFAVVTNTADVTDSVDKGAGPNGFDIIKPTDVDTVQGDGTTPTTFDHLLYGVNPIQAGLATDPGAYNVGNGSLIQFDDAYNSVVYAFANGNDTVIPDADLLGSQSAIDAAQATGSNFGAAGYFFDAGVADLAAYAGF